MTDQVYFVGRVDIENEEQLNLGEDTKEENSVIMESEMQLPATTGTLNKPDLSENTSSQNTQINTQNSETETDMTDLVMNLFSPVEESQDSTDKKPSSRKRNK